MNRREFIGLLGATPVIARDARAQASVPVVGFLSPVSRDTYAFAAAAFQEGLAEAGFVDGANVRIEYRWGNGDYTRLPTLASELAAANVAAIAATGDVASAKAAQGATGAIPIVFTIGADPVRHGLVASLNRPGGNVTGIHLFSSILSGKRLELLTQIAPNVRRIALIANPDNHSALAERREAEEGARVLGRELVTVMARKPDEIGPALAEALRLQADSLITGTDPLILDRRGPIVAFAQRHSLPTIGFVRQFAVAGSLLSYGPSVTWMYRKAGLYIGQVLKGAKPAEMPVLQPTEFETVVNLRTARTLDIDAPALIVALASEVIE